METQMNSNITNDNFTCPFCNSVFYLDHSTFSSDIFSFDTLGTNISYASNKSEEIQLNMYRCPSCKQVTVKTIGLGKQYENEITNIYPKSLAKQLPHFIPSVIIEDYQEAYSILNLSPKASATLSRRCLQSIIRGFWKITNEKNLYDEIESVKDFVSPEVAKAMHSMRQLGNIGAHSEKDINKIIDVEPHEAEILIKFIEFMIEISYIQKHNTEELLNNVNNINSDKKTKKLTKS